MGIFGKVAGPELEWWSQSFAYFLLELGPLVKDLRHPGNNFRSFQAFLAVAQENKYFIWDTKNCV